MAKCKLIRSSIPAEITFKNLYLAWTNPSPGSTFPSQDITLNTSECPDYDKIRVIGMSGSNYQFSVDITRGYNAHLSANGSNNTSMYRLMARVSDTKYTVGSGYSGSTQMDNVMIPLFIYVYKDNPIAKVTTIASEIKTNAANCMMPNGVTSVADTIKDFEYKTSSAISADFTATKNGYLFVHSSLVFTSQQHTGTAYVRINNMLVYDHSINSPALSSGYNFHSALLPIHKGDIVTFATTNCTWVTRNFISS